MRKMVIVTLVTLLMVIMSSQIVFAEDEEPILDEARIDITIEDNVYSVKQTIVLSNFQGEQVTHNTKEITENKLTNVTFIEGDEELAPVIEDGETLHKYTITPEGSGDKVSYTIEYNVEKKENVFEVPLFVPEYATSGDNRVIKITFQAPEGNKIQKNSFPNVIKKDQTYVEKEMANIPAIAKYIYAENPTVFHSFNVISFIAIFSIFLLLVGWAIVEKRRGGNK